MVCAMVVCGRMASATASAARRFSWGSRGGLQGYTRGTHRVLEGYSSKRCAQVLVGLFEFDRQAANVTLFEEGDSGHKLYLVRPARTWGGTGPDMGWHWPGQRP